ncbi:LysR family transcriptional regulator [Variovorax gossypii]
MSDIIGLDPKLLVAFIAAAEELHFGRAAARMYMSQPPFSQLIQRLENLVGAQLFERTTRSVRLTPAGHAMQDGARAVVDQLNLMLREVQRAALGEAGALCIGMAPTAACSPLAEKLYAYRRAHPQIELELREMNSNAMEAALRQRVIDVALMRPLPMDSDIEVVEALEEPMLLAVRKDGAHGQKDSIALEEVADLSLVGYVQTVSPYFRQMLQAMFAAIKRRPRIVQESVIPTILTLVEAGVGAAVVPWSVSRARDSVLVFLPISNPGLPRARIIVAKRAGPTQDVIAVNKFVAALQQ